MAGTSSVENCKSSEQMVCRDFLRNVCTRGDRCKYPHQADAHAGSVLEAAGGVRICHDYQNWNCERSNCRYLHVTKEEENTIKETGLIPGHLCPEQMRNPLAYASLSALKGEKPICKDNLIGRCGRGSSCKFRHVHQQSPSPSVYESSDGGDYHSYSGSTSSTHPNRCYPAANPTYLNKPHSSDHRYQPYPSGATTTSKGFSVLDSELGIQEADFQAALLKENAILRMKVEKLQRQCEDLSNANEFLLSSNARLRFAKVADLSVVTVSSAMTPVVSPVVVGMAASATNTQAQLSVLKPTHMVLDNDLVAEAALRHQVQAQQAAAAQAQVAQAQQQVVQAQQQVVQAQQVAGLVSLAPQIPHQSMGGPPQACQQRSQASLIPMRAAAQPGVVAIAGTQANLVPMAAPTVPSLVSQPSLIPIETTLVPTLTSDL